jgi:hypothetical protein
MNPERPSNPIGATIEWKTLKNGRHKVTYSHRNKIIATDTFENHNAAEAFFEMCLNHLKSWLEGKTDGDLSKQ